MTDQAPERRKPNNTLSNILAVAAVLLALLAVVLYLRPGGGIAPVPLANQFFYRLGCCRADHGSRVTAIGHDERLPRLHATEQLSALISHLPVRDSLHVAHGSTH